VKKVRFLSLTALIAAMLISLIGPTSQLGIAVASESSQPPQGIVDRMNNIYNVLDEDEKNDVRNARNRVKNLTPDTQTYDGQFLLKEVWDKIENKLIESGGGPEFNLITQQNLVRVISVLGVNYYPDGSSLSEAFDEIQDTLNQLAQLADVTPDPGAEDIITWDDVEEYSTLLEDAVLSELSGAGSIDGLINLFGNKSGLIELAEEAVVKLRDESSSDNKLLQIIRNLDISSQDLKDTAKRVYNAVDADREASKALMLGYVRTKAWLEEDVDHPGKYTLQIDGLPNLLIIADPFDWATDHPDDYNIYTEDGKVVIAPKVASPASNFKVIGTLNLQEVIRLTAAYSSFRRSRQGRALSRALSLLWMIRLPINKVTMSNSYTSFAGQQALLSLAARSR